MRVPQPSPEQIILGHRAALALVRTRVKAFARTAWVAQGSYRDADIDRLVALIVPRVQAGQLQVANLTSAYIASIATLRGGALVAPARVNRGIVLDGRGVPAEDVYRRPASAVYNGLAEGKSYSDSLALGALLLGTLIATDMQMSMVRQARESYQAQGVTLYVRVLNGGKNCDLCIDASGKSYHTEDLSPIHPGCSCSTDAAGTEAPSIDRSTLGNPDIEVAVREHGEMGPTLTNAADHFTGPN